MNQLKKLKLDGVLYTIGDSMENAMRVAPTLAKAPNLGTKSYIKDDVTINFVIGDLCRVADKESESGYYFYRLHDINSEDQYIWSRLDTGVLDESAIVTVKVTSNQDTTEDLIDKVSVHFECEEASDTITYQGKDIYFLVPAKAEYNITFDAGDSNYLAPAKITETATANSRPIHQVEFKAEKLTVKVSASDDTDVSDATITVNGEAKTGDLTWTIPFNTVYTIEASTKEGYTTVISENNITANQKSREITITYNSFIIAVVNIFTNLNFKKQEIIQTVKEITIKSETKQFLDDGSASIKFPFGTKVTESDIIVSDVKGYKKSVVIKDTTEVANVPPGSFDIYIHYNAELVKATSNLTDVDLIVNGETVHYDDTAVEVLVPFNTAYTVTGLSLTGYTVNSQLFTANTATRNVTVTYKKQSGEIRGLLADGTEVSFDDISSSCVGVICRDTEHNIEFIVGKLSNDKIVWGYNHDDDDYLEIPTSKLPYRYYKDGFDKGQESMIYEWYNSGYTGPSNTDIIVEAAEAISIPEKDCAAKWCANLTLTVNGRILKGYLGCAAEMLVIRDNIEDFFKAMMKMGNTTVTNSNLFMSELYSNENAWALWTYDEDDTEFSFTDKVYNSEYVLPFFRLDRTVGGGIINGYEYIDMGLSVKWATYNIGATRPEEYGYYFQWGGTTPYNSDRTPVGGGSTINFGGNSNCPYWVSGLTFSSKWSKYTGSNSYSSTGKADNKTILDPEDDAAHVNIGGNWRMPTEAEYKELINACNLTWVTNYNGTDINGQLFTLKTDPSKTLFFPASGNLNGTNWINAGSYLIYWSSSLGSPDSCYGRFLISETGYYYMDGGDRYSGLPIRAVLPK